MQTDTVQTVQIGGSGQTFLRVFISRARIRQFPAFIFFIFFLFFLHLSNYSERNKYSILMSISVSKNCPECWMAELFRCTIWTNSMKLRLGRKFLLQILFSFSLVPLKILCNKFDFLINLDFYSYSTSQNCSRSYIFKKITQSSQYTRLQSESDCRHQPITMPEFIKTFRLTYFNLL